MKDAGATAAGEDGSLVVPATLIPTFTLSTPLKAPSVLNTNVSLIPSGSVFNESWSVSTTIALAGAQAGGTINIGNAAPGIWRLTIWEEVLFTGTTNAAKDIDMRLLPEPPFTGTPKQLWAHLYQTSAAPRATVLSMDLTFEDQTHFELTFSPTVAGDVLNQVQLFQMQRVF